MIDIWDSMLVWEYFEQTIQKIDNDYRERFPTPYGEVKWTRLDIMSHYAEYFKRYFEAVLFVLQNPNTTDKDILLISSIIDRLAWADTYFLETYNEHGRRELVRWIAPLLLNPSELNETTKALIILLLQQRILSENERILWAQEKLDTTLMCQNIMASE